MDASCNNLGIVHRTNVGCQDIIYKNVFFCSKIYFTHTSSVDPDEMPQAAFHLGFQFVKVPD